MCACPSRLGMLIFCMQHALEVHCVHMAALLLPAGHSAQVLEYDGSICMMDNRPYQGWRRLYVGAIKGRRALRSLYVLIVQHLTYNSMPHPLFDVYHYQARWACARHYCVFVTLVIIFCGAPYLCLFMAGFCCQPQKATEIEEIIRDGSTKG